MRPSADSEVGIWTASLALDHPGLERLAALLSRDERTRAGRFHFPRDRCRFLAARGILRRILSEYAGEPAESLRFEYGPEGKPFLPRYPTLMFNLSHSDDLLLVGVCRGRSIGVDIERVPAIQVVDSVSPMVFSGPERRALERLEPAARCEEFARLWTRKEAVIKADGRGMSLSLDHIDVGTTADRARLLDRPGGAWAESPRWRLRTLSTARGYAAAVAVEGDSVELVSPTEVSLIEYFR